MKSYRDLPTLTPCTEPAPVRESLGYRRVARALFLCSLLGAFGVGQLYLRFAIGDLRREQQETQIAARKLQIEMQRLQVQNASLSDLATIEEIARTNLKMEDVPALAHVEENLPEDLKSKYFSGNGSGAGNMSLPVSEEESPPILHRVADTLGTINRAFAGAGPESSLTQSR
ncbi:MAG: cell division protein FtsL [Candidatus Sumerlaeaceae bacterium]|nr:cell division protein FtsL [Candidatus Sumerlaeaceae bacterium]